MTKKTIEQKVSKVFDSDTAKSGLVHLNTQQADKFIDYIVDEWKILKEAKVVRMTKPTLKIANLDIDDEIFVPWVRGVETQAHIKAKAMEKELVTKEITSTVRIYDDELQDNLEWNAFKDHLFRLIAKKGSTQLEKVGLYAKKVEGAKSLMWLFNWFITETERNGNVVDATLWDNRYIDRSKLSLARKSIPDTLIDLVNKLYMPNKLMWDYEDKYIDSQNRVPTDRLGGWKFEWANLLGKGRAVVKPSGFATTLSENVIAWATTIKVEDGSGAKDKTIAIALWEGQEHITRVVAVNSNTLTLEAEVPYSIDITNTNQAKVVEVLTDGLDTFFTPKENMVYGIQKDFTLEADRMPKLRATDYVITARIDLLLLNPSASCVIKGLKTK